MAFDLESATIDENLSSKFDLSSAKVVENEEIKNLGKFGNTIMSSAPGRNIITDFIDCLKWVGNTTMSAYQEGQKQTEIAHLEAKDMFKVINSKEKSRLNYLSNTPSKNYRDYGIKDEKYIDENITNFAPRMANKAKKGYVEAINMLPYMWETIKTGGIGTGIGTVGGAAVGAGIGLATTKANTLQLALQGAKYGGSLCGRIAGSAKMAELEGGLARNELKRINQEIIEKGGKPLSELEIDLLAIGVGGVNAGLETVGLRQALKTVPGGGKILQYLEKKNLKELATDLTVREQLGKALTQYAKSIGTEITTEMAQEATNIIAEETARKLGKIDATPLEENVARVLQTGKATFGAMAFIGGVGTAAKCTSIMIKQGVSPKKAVEETAKMSAEEQSDFVNDNYDTLMETAKNSETEQKKEYAQAHEKMYQDNIKNGMSKNFAKKSADIGMFFVNNLAEKLDVSINDALTLTPEVIKTNKRIVFDDNRAKKVATARKQSEVADFFSNSDEVDSYLLNRLSAEGLETLTPEQRKELAVDFAIPVNARNSHYQSAMYKSPLESFEDFYNQVIEKEDNSKQNGENLKKSFFEFKNQNVDLRIPHDTVIHVENGHNLEISEWADFLKNITTPTDITISNKPRYDGLPLLLRYNFNGKTYGAVIEFFENKKPILTTVFSDEEKNVVNWIKENSHFQAKNTSSVTTKGMLLDNDYNSILSYFQNNLNPSEQENNIFYQSVYHGTPHRFDEFSTEHIGSGNSIEQRTDKAKYLTDNEVEQLKKDQENFESYIEKLLNNELSHRTQIRVLEHLTSPYDKIVNLKGKKVVITQDVYKKIIDLPNKFNKNHNIDRNRALRLPQLIADPLYILKSNSEGNEHRFVIVTSSKGNFQGQKLSIILNPKNTVAIVSAYDEKIDISKEKKAGRVLYSKKEELSKTILTSKARAINNSNIIIANNSDNFNPADNTVYQNKNVARGFYQLDKNLITILKDGNVDTVIHEYAHWYLNALASLEGSSQKVDDALADIRKFLKNDGSKFSDKQHEKFAKACEKYFYSGYAKNNKLKAIFEDIKNILHSVYDKLFDKDGRPYFAEFTEEDNKHIKELFDDIFAAEKNRVKNVVFDKVDKLEQMISDIKTKEKQELAEIEKIRSGIEAEIKESGEIKKDVQALIDDSAKYADRKQNARWKDYNENRQKIAYDIIATAVGIPVKELKQKLHSKNEKTRENIELKIREVSDKLDVAGYAERPDIEEFFGSINFDEIGANQELVDMAMQAIDSKVDFDSELDKELNFFMNRFDYLNNKLQKTKGKQAAYIAEAMLEIFSGMRYESLPAPFTKDLGEKIMHAMEKNDLKDYRNSSLRASDFYGGQVLQKLKQIKLYSPKDGYAIRIDRFHALYAELPYATNAVNTIKIIKKINRLIIDDIRQRQKGLIAKEISRQIKINSKIITTKFGNRKGRFDWQTNSVFHELESLNRVNLQKLEKEYDDLASEVDCILLNTDNGFCNDLTGVKENSTVEFSFDKCLKKKFIEYKRSKSLKDIDVQLLLSLLSDIIELKEKGRTSKNKEELEKRLQRYDLRNDLSQRIKNNSKLQNYLIKWAATNDSTLNLNFILRLCFGEDTVDKYSLDQEETEAQIYARRHLMSFYNNALRIYKIKSPTKIAKWLWNINGINKLQKMFREYEKEGYRVLEHLYDYKTKEEKVDEIIINRAEIITLYAWDQNPLLHKRLINQFGKVQLDDLFAKLSPQDQTFALKMIEECDSMFEDTNEVMIRSQGLALEKVENYFPSIVKRHGDAIDNSVLLNVRIGKPSVTKKRVKSEYIAMNPKNPLSIFSSHVDKVASYVCVSEKASFVSEIIGTPDLARAFETRFNKDYEIAKKSKSKAIKSQRTTDGAIIYKKIAEQVAASTFFKYAQSVNTLNKLGKTIADNFIVQAIGWSPKIAFGQLLSVINYADGSDITIAEWTVGFARAIADPKKTFEFMLQDEYLQARFYGNLQNETMQALLNDFDKWKSVKTFFTTNIRYGDIIAICMGGRPYVEHLMSQGFTKEEAFRRFRRKTNEAQQSSLPSTISNYQRLSQSSFLHKVFLAFKNTDHQYERKFLEAFSGLIRGDVPKSAAIKSILLYRVVNPLLFSWILNQLGLWTLLFGDDDDKIASLQGAGLALLSANLGAYGLLGVSLATLLSMANRILSGKGGLYKTEIPLISDVEGNSTRILSDIKNGELRTETFIGFLVMTLGLGMGVPAQKIYNIGSGIYDITNGEVAVGIAKMLGWSDSVARKTFDY